MKIIKHSGDIVDFEPEKLRKSLLKSGANPKIVEDIVSKICKEIYEGISTKHIYKRAFGLLKKEANSHAARYNLRAAIQLLGPAGFFFEKYIAKLFSAEKYETKNNIILQGKCVSHEIDVLVKKNNAIAMMECKFHVSREAASDVKVPLYVLSRFNDLKGREHTIFSKKEMISKCWIVTNNRFTADAIDFAKCSGMNLLSWDYPKNDNLKTKNDIDCLYPITCLTTLTIAEKDKLLILDVILVKELINNSDSLEKIGLSLPRIKNVLKEARELSRCVLNI
ncbi:ATP cone domain-containing protein [Flavobacterium acetivorans]|uniref:ATP cone domain-containing protein n=1 Tax=Flavobacterium acetivorans TaxID=2893883 RepID=UPI001E373935|nr:ATP cone domain-containing protein [Flavobacterium sp. F-29]UFH36775.1 restriction endonuclease [Flavobacterium sp. F-29]